MWRYASQGVHAKTHAASPPPLQLPGGGVPEPGAPAELAVPRFDARRRQRPRCVVRNEQMHVGRGECWLVLVCSCGAAAPGGPQPADQGWARRQRRGCGWDTALWPCPTLEGKREREKPRPLVATVALAAHRTKRQTARSTVNNGTRAPTASETRDTAPETGRRGEPQPGVASTPTARGGASVNATPEALQKARRQA
eukprot:scaffold5725_cov387-Prasinococcus_capsulatus_cf.AAC.5